MAADFRDPNNHGYETQWDPTIVNPQNGSWEQEWQRLKDVPIPATGKRKPRSSRTRKKGRKK